MNRKGAGLGYYQSHQSGIETAHWNRRPCLVTATNRTNLELKPRTSTTSSRGRSLPIAPIWNWNTKIKFPLPKSVFTTNRTNLELKLVYDGVTSYPSHTTNRTNLELKPIIAGLFSGWSCTTNRTNLELKRPLVSAAAAASVLPIAPIWNWNSLPRITPGSVEFYQSHQSGIETAFNFSLHLLPELPIAPIWNWNHSVTIITIAPSALPIAPIWNWNK